MGVLQIMEPGLGLAQIDVIIYPPSNAWDDAFDLYCPVNFLNNSLLVFEIHFLINSYENNSTTHNLKLM